jgi:hypothetical protein
MTREKNFRFLETYLPGSFFKDLIREKKIEVNDQLTKGKHTHSIHHCPFITYGNIIKKLYPIE